MTMRSMAICDMENCSEDAAIRNAWKIIWCETFGRAMRTFPVNVRGDLSIALVEKEFDQMHLLFGDG